MAEYSITLTDEELEEVRCGLGLIIDRCCDDEEEKPTIDLIAKINKQTRYTADVVKVKHGEWLWNKGCTYDESPYYCSLCIEGGSVYGGDNYCPNCGAKMDGEKKEGGG